MYGPVNHYYMIVMPEANARKRVPDDFTISQVCDESTPSDQATFSLK